MRDPIIILKKNGKEGLLNTDTGFILEPKYEKIERCEDNDNLFLLLISRPPVYFQLYCVSKGIVSEMGYNNITDFRNGYASVAQRNFQGVINLNGEEILPCLYTEMGVVSHDICIMKSKDLMGAYNVKEKKVCIPYVYKKLSDFFLLQNNLRVALARTSDDTWGIINEKNETIIKFIYTDLLPIDEDIIMVTQNNKKGLVNIKGEIILPPIYDHIPLDPTFFNNKISETDEKEERVDDVEENAAQLIKKMKNLLEKLKKTHAGDDAFMAKCNKITGNKRLKLIEKELHIKK
jgi:hypothetical protein